MRVTECIPGKRGKVTVSLDTGLSFSLYQRELAAYGLRSGEDLADETWEKLRSEVLDIRAKRRAMYLLERMDRTESQLRRKLTENGYPPESIEQAVDYVKSFHYVDDERYAETYIRCRQQQKSRLQLKTGLLQKGISPDVIEAAMEAAYEGGEEELIRKLLDKKHYDPEEMDRQEQYRIYQSLMRKGFSGSAVRRCMEMR